MAFAAARMIKDKEAKMIAGQKLRSTEINQSYSKYNLQKVKGVKEQGGSWVVQNY